jgi:uncharacterized membrane protein
VLSFFGFIHGQSLGFGASTPVAIGYLLIAATCVAVGWRERRAAQSL